MNCLKKDTQVEQKPEKQVGVIGIWGVSFSVRLRFRSTINRHLILP